MSRSRIVTQSLMAAVIGFGLISQTTSAATSAAAETPKVCDQVIQSLKSEWKVVDYQAPSKPTAMRVEGKYGHENSAGQVAYMQSEMKKAESDCQSGNQQSALQRVSLVRDLMDAHGISEATANAAMIQK